MAARYRICAAAAPSPSTIINPLSSPIQYPCGFEAGVQSKINARLGMASELLSQGARHSGGQGIFLDLLHASERTGTQGQRPGGPKELSPGRQPWVQKALLFARAPAGRKKRFRRGNSPQFCRSFRGLTGACLSAQTSTLSFSLHQNSDFQARAPRRPLLHNSSRE